MVEPDLKFPDENQLSNYPAAPYPGRIWEVMIHPNDEQGSAFEAFRKGLIDQVTGLLPEGFAGPTRERGEAHSTWESHQLVVTLWPAAPDRTQGLSIFAKDPQAAAQGEALSRRIFAALAAAHRLTLFDRGWQVPYSPTLE